MAGRDRFCSRGAVLGKPALERHDDRFAQMGSQQIIVEPDEAEVELFGPCRTLLGLVSHFHDAELERIARRLAVEIERPDAISPLAASALTLDLLACATRRVPRRRTGKPPQWLERAHDLLRDTFRGSPTLTAIAREVGVHPAYLARLFRMHYGCSVGTFVRHLRLEAAAAELATSDTTVAHVALAFGFSDQSHFTRHFRRRFGYTPREYQDRHRGS